MSGLLLELCLEVLQEVVVKVFTTQVSITSSGLYGKDTTSDVEKGDIESSSTEIEDENVLLGFALLVKTIGNGSSGGLVDNTQDVKSSDGTSILGGKTLRVVKVGWNTMKVQ